MDRAYSLISVKGFDPKQRTFNGIATAPVPDRVGDVIDSKGIRYKNPLPLMLYHDSKKPVGEARFSGSTKDGTPFTARISTIDRQSGIVKDRLDEAVDSLSADPPLIRGVSIGFRPLKDPIYIKETGGYRFEEIEVMELSMVVIPAHQDATIALVKSLDSEQRSASRPPAPSSAGASASPRPTGRRESPMNVNEQIVEVQKSLLATSDRIKVLAPSVTGDEVDATVAKEYDDLVERQATLDAKLKRLDALERAQIGSEPLHGVAGSNAKSAFGSRGGFGHISVEEPKLPPGIAFTRAVIAKMAARLNAKDGNYQSAWQVAEQRYPSHPSIAAYLKTTIPGGTTTGTGSGSPQTGWGDDLLVLNTTFAAGFMEYLRPQTIVGRVNLTRVPFNTRIQSQTTGGSARWVGQGVQKPVTKYDFDAINLGFAKVAAICVLSQELIRFSSPSAETIVRNQLAKTLGDRLDQDFIDPDVAAVTNVSPASITRGATVLTPSGTNLAAVNTDIQTIVGRFISANIPLTNLTWIMPNSVALSLSLMLNSLGNRAFPDMGVNGGTLAGIPVVTSQWANSISTSPTKGNLVILLDGSSIFLADDGNVTVDASDEASIEMSDDPVTDAGNVMVSMYQTNQVALRAERFINWARGRTASVVVFGNVLWAA